jgi:hypothetical protein
MEPSEALRAQGGQDCHLLLVALELLLLAPLSRMLRRLGFRVCYECLVPLVKLGVVRVIEVEVRQLELGGRLRWVHYHGLQRLRLR